ncbi:hypothetical protein ACSBR2_019235 [Camellia fascicularis]
MGELNVFFFPIMAHGHMILTLDIAKLFTAHSGVKSTIITTLLNAHLFTKSIERAKHAGIDINIITIKVPTAEAGLPEGCESADQFTSDDMIPKFFKATTMLQAPLELVLQEHCLDCLVADMFFPWATNSAAKYGIPRLVFHGISFFTLCALESLRLYKPQMTVSSDDEPFVVPNLPHEIKLRNFYELEPDYVDHYRNVLGRRAWHIGPVSLCNREIEDKAQRGKEASIDEHDCLKWLNLKKPNSVIYICFGTVANFPSQLYEIAMGLESSGQQFI